MTKTKSFTHNPIQVNTYLIYDETKECIIIDPACYNKSEKNELSDFISENRLIPVKIINTHGHFDHITGNKYLAEKYNIDICINNNDLELYKNSKQSAMLFGIEFDEFIDPNAFIEDNEKISFGNTNLVAKLSPGHSPGSIILIDHENKYVISGDVLFYNGIGRTDLPGGDMDTLLKSIRENIFTLGEDFKVYPGHGPATSVGMEKNENPFLV